ncbi:hypothetical protein GCM10022220_31810 [Actinocatenispora rupis]|uniref:Dynamin family protein n=1 Tax=Actinocatenispora rupis TaxID=519421 RepID=A0A8J3J806_9ACTN|nr:hypothetical protein Aru02nite_42400 [Actinocatenispora rupis]
MLAEALRGVRDAVAGARFALTTAGAEEARRTAREITGQLDAYLRPRLDTLSGPLLVVVCGPTGAGKSTLVNSLVRAPVSRSGALRPTTKAPVLAASGADAAWFGRPHLLPTFARTGGNPPAGRHLQVVTAPALPSGLALLDAPDIDSVVAGNRDIAAELMAAADLWLFVTTATRYADETAWQVLDAARDRDVAVAVVLDRVPPDAGRAVRRDLRSLLEDADLADAPVFELAESATDDEGLLPDDAVAPLRDWLLRLAGDAHESAAIARQTLDGAVGTLPERLVALADESDEQLRAAEELRATAHAAHRTAVSTMDEAIRDGGLLGGELAARWEELIAGGELLRAVRSRSGRLWDQLSVSLAGRSEPGSRFVPAAEAALRTLFTDTLTDAARQTADAWSATPAGTALLPDVGDPDPDDPVATWFDDLLDWVRTDSGQRSVARQTSYTLQAVRLLVLVAVLVAPARTAATGTERAMLDTVLADPVVRRLTTRAREELSTRFHALTDTRRRRYDAVLNRVTVDEATGERLRTAAVALGPARTAAALAPAYHPLPAPVPPAPPAPAASSVDLPGPDDPIFHPAGTDDAGVVDGAGTAPDPGDGERRRSEVLSDGAARTDTHDAGVADPVSTGTAPEIPAESGSDGGPVAAASAGSGDGSGGAAPGPSASAGAGRDGDPAEPETARTQLLPPRRPVPGAEPAGVAADQPHEPATHADGDGSPAVQANEPDAERVTSSAGRAGTPGGGGRESDRAGTEPAQPADVPEGGADEPAPTDRPASTHEPESADEPGATPEPVDDPEPAHEPDDGPQAAHETVPTERYEAARDPGSTDDAGSAHEPDAESGAVHETEAGPADGPGAAYESEAAQGPGSVGAVRKSGAAGEPHDLGETPNGDGRADALDVDGGASEQAGSEPTRPADVPEGGADGATPADHDSADGLAAADDGSRDEPVPADRASTDDAVPADHGSADERAEADHASSDEPASAERASADEPVPADQASADEPVPADQASSEDLVPADQGSADGPAAVDEHASPDGPAADDGTADQPAAVNRASTEESADEHVTTGKPGAAQSGGGAGDKAEAYDESVVAQGNETAQPPEATVDAAVRGTQEAAEPAVRRDEPAGTGDTTAREGA